MKTTFEISQKNIKHYIGIVELKIDDKLYHVRPLKGSKVWSGCAYAYTSPQGLKDASLYKLYFIPESEMYFLPCYRAQTSISKYYRGYKPIVDVLERNNANYMDATDMVPEIATWHKYLNFYLFKLNNNGHKQYAKILDAEFEEAVRHLHRCNIRNFEIAHVTDLATQMAWSSIDAKLNKTYYIYCVDDEALGFKPYVHVNRVTDTDKHSSKDGWIIFMKQGSVERFVLMYHTYTNINSETAVIKANGFYNNFIQKVAR